MYGFMELVNVAFSGGCLGKNQGCEKAGDEIARLLGNVKAGVISAPDVDAVTAALEKAQGRIFVGGDHSITYGLVRGLPRDKGIILLDAHADVKLGTKSVDHECWLRKLIEEKIVQPEHVLLVGVRMLTEIEKKFLKEHRIRVIKVEELFEMGIDEMCDEIMEFCRHFKQAYLSIDIDVVDPAYAPGTGYLEPGGFSSRELLYLVKRLKMLKNLQRVDLVEVNPERDVQGMTCKLAAQIIAELG